MLAQPLEEADILGLDAAAFRAEWKWDGIRVQLVATSGGRRLYSRGADDISAAFPDIIAAMDFHAVLDGELLVIRDGVVAPFADLQQRLSRKSVTQRMMEAFPVGVRFYDLLFDGEEDLRACRSMRGGHGWRSGSRPSARRGWTSRHSLLFRGRGAGRTAPRRAGQRGWKGSC